MAKKAALFSIDEELLKEYKRQCDECKIKYSKPVEWFLRRFIKVNVTPEK